MRPDVLHLVVSDYNRIKAELIERYKLDEDDDFLIDSLEGATDLNELVVALAREVEVVKAKAEAMNAIIEANEARKARYIRQRDSLRQTIANICADTGVKKASAPDISVSFLAPKQKPVITDAALLPDWAIRTKTIDSVNLEAINDVYRNSVADGVPFEVSGVTISNGTPSITIRTK